MRRAITRGIGLLTCGLLMTSGGIAAAQPVGTLLPQCVANAKTTTTVSAVSGGPQHFQDDARTDASFFFSLAADGGIRVTARAGELEVDKVVYRDGRSVVVLKAGADRVSVAVNVVTVEVERGDEQRRLDVLKAGDEEWLQVRVMLAGSKALRLFRALASSFDPSTLKTPAGAAVVLSDAVLGYLDGDLGAISRLTRQMRAAVQARIKPVRLTSGGQESEKDCWHTYEGETMHAMDDYDSCMAMFKWYDPRRAACLTVWTLQAEVAWAELISCAGLHVVGG